MTTSSVQLKQAMVLLLKVVSDPKVACTAIRLGKGVALCTRLNFTNGSHSLLSLRGQNRQYVWAPSCSAAWLLAPPTPVRANVN